MIDDKLAGNGKQKPQACVQEKKATPAQEKP